MEASERNTGMRYRNELELKDALGIESWRNLSKDTFFRFLEKMPDTDPEVALRLISQIPEITTLARSAIDDAAKAHEATLASNDRGQETVHQVHMERLAILRAELDRDLSPEHRLRVLDDIREVNANALEKDSENKRFLSEQLDKRLATMVAASAAVLAVVVTAARSGHVPKLGAGRLFKS